MDRSVENDHVEDGFRYRNPLPSMDAYLSYRLSMLSQTVQRIKLVAGVRTSYSPEAPAIGASTGSPHFWGGWVAVIPLCDPFDRSCFRI